MGALARHLVIVIISVAAVSAATAAAHACGRSDDLFEPEPTLDDASDYLVLGEYREALRIAVGQSPGIIRKGADWVVGKAWRRRVGKVVAVATVRSVGRWRAVLNTPELPTRASRRAQLVWARDVLAALSRRAPADAKLKAHYAEALAAFPTTRRQAAEVLTTLYGKDQLSEPQSFAVLATLLDDNRASLRGKVTRRCTELAFDDAICTVL